MLLNDSFESNTDVLNALPEPVPRGVDVDFVPVDQVTVGKGARACKPVLYFAADGRHPLARLPLQTVTFQI